MKALFRKTLHGLAPADERAEEMLRKVKPDTWLMVEFKRMRNPDHHRKFFAMLNLIQQNQEHYKSVDELLAAFKLAIGHTETIRTKRGDIHIPKSISFGNMDQTAFDDFYRRAVDFMVSDVIPGLDRAELERELMEFAA